MELRKMLYQTSPAPRVTLDPYAMPAVQPIVGVGYPPAPEAPTQYEAEPLYEILRQPMADVLEGMDEHTLRLLAFAAARRVRVAEEERRLKYYREPFFYAVNIGAQGVDAAAIAAGATSPQGRNRIRTESGSNFEAYFGTRWTQNTVTGAVNTSRFRSRVFYAGSKGVTSEDESAPAPAADQLRRDNAWGSAQRPTRYVWPRIFPASTSIEHEFTNDEAVNPVNAQLVWWGNKVMCGKDPRRLVAKPPYRREPFTFAMSFIAAAAGVQVPGNVQMLEHADFELLYITQDSPDGNAGDFEFEAKEADGGQKSLMNIPIRRDAGFGTVERPTILTYPRYYVRGSRVLGFLVNRDFALAAQSFQIAFHGNLII